MKAAKRCPLRTNYVKILMRLLYAKPKKQFVKGAT